MRFSELAQVSIQDSGSLEAPVHRISVPRDAGMITRSSGECHCKSATASAIPYCSRIINRLSWLKATIRINLSAIGAQQGGVRGKKGIPTLSQATGLFAPRLPEASNALLKVNCEKFAHLGSSMTLLYITSVAIGSAKRFTCSKPALCRLF
jgi:hypothetical protein